MKRLECSQGTCHFHFVRHFQFAMLRISLGISNLNNIRSNDINILKLDIHVAGLNRRLAVFLNNTFCAILSKFYVPFNDIMNLNNLSK